MKISRAFVPCALLLSLSSPALADEPHQHGVAPSERAGKVVFPISRSDAARGYFEKLLVVAKNHDGRQNELAEARGVLAAK